MYLFYQTLILLLNFLSFVGDITVVFFMRFFVALFISIKSIKAKIRWFFSILHKRFTKNHSRRRRKKKKIAKFYLIGLRFHYFVVGAFFSFLFLFIPLLLTVTAQMLPDITTLKLQQFPQTTNIYDRHHTLLYQIYATQNRTLIHLSNVPLNLQHATIAIEDKNFYNNPGFDITAIARAALSDIEGKSLQGGSTITQQLIKSSLLSPQQTVTRKLEEVFLSFLAQQVYTKDQILEMYFNQVPYGGTAWGIEAASQTYFGKEVRNLDLAQSAFLAGLPQAPTLYSPFENNNNLWKKRQEDVLAHMRSLNYITALQEQEADKETLHFIQPRTPLLAPHFVMYIRSLLIQKYGLALVEKGGLNVITSLDLPTQNMAQQVVADEISKDEYLQLTNGAAVITNPQNGDILAMVGSKDYFASDIDGEVNLATSLRQPGSSIKIVTYAAALSRGFTPATILDDSPVVFKNPWETYVPVNYDGKFHGRVTLRTAFANSFNIPAIKTLNTIGIPVFVTTGRAMGISHLQDASQYGLSVTLGSADVTMLDMATAYGTLANYGNHIDLNPIISITDARGNILEQKNDIQKTPVISDGVAFLISNILSDNNARSWEFGTNSPLYIPNHTVAVKTGTTDSKRDNWTDGYTPNYVVIVWVGNNNNAPMSPVLASGITGAAPIWHDIMMQLLHSSPDHPFPIPSSIVSKPCLGHIEYFLKGTENNPACIVIYPTFTPIPAH
ncbi:MAG TPA: transglycosylase domain-containing protein [Patescibacteria group bacterium]|nr:transglycosylase domain-containing protein [Patescibacteria group bacterium]